MPYFKHFRHFLEEGIALVFPSRCLLCSTQDTTFVEPTLCQNCWETIFRPTQLVLPLVLPTSGEKRVEGYAAAEYMEPLRPLIVKAKFHADSRAFAPLPKLLEETMLRVVATKPTVVTAVPGDPKRLRSRGVDVPALLARRLCRKL